LECGAIFSTEEQAITDKSVVFRNSSALEPFSREKLLLSVYEALRHRKTAISDATALCDTIWSKTYLHITDGAIQRDDLVRITADILKRFDKAGATVYLAFHPLRTT
jgi:transcriptional regulator NrdR family protein